jgi:tetratricopeptide (TPR) repeat protein
MFWFIIALLPNIVWANEAQFQSLDQYTRIQIPVTGASTYRMISGKTGETTVSIDRISPTWLQSLQSATDGRVKGVKVISTGLDRVDLQLQFATPNTESFAYLQGGKLVLDIWQQEGAAKEEAKPARSLATVSDKPKKEIGKAPTVRGPQSAENSPKKRGLASRGLASLPRPKQEESLKPLSKEVNIFQRFMIPMPDLVIPAVGDSIQLPPKGDLDRLWKFAKGDSKTVEGRSFEFAKKLYQEKKYGLAIKTIQIIQRDEKNSPHLDEIRFLEALSFRKLGEIEKSEALLAKGEALLEELGSVRRADGSLMSYHGAIRFYFAQKEYLKGNWLQAIMHLEYVTQMLANTDNNYPYTQIMLADAYARVNQPRRAERVFRFLVEKYGTHVVGKEAKYRIADLLSLEKNYERVIQEGEAAIETSPEYEKNRAEVVFQIGEASFWLGQYKRAEKYFKKFTDKYSAQTIAAFAWVRLGEIAELSRGDLDQARTFYLNAKNGYPFSQGDLVASVRLARIDIEREKDPNFVLKSLGGLLKDKTIENELRYMAELTYIQYLLVTQQVDAAIDASKEGMAKSEGIAFEAYTDKLVKSLYAKFAQLKEEKKFAEALAFYEKEKKWIDLYGAETFAVLADTHKGLGLYATANQMMERYISKVNGDGRMLASVGKNSEYSYSKAKNLFEMGNYAGALEFLPDYEDAKILWLRAEAEYHLGRKKVATPLADKAMATYADEYSDEELVALLEIQKDRSFQDRDFARLEKETRLVMGKLAKESIPLQFSLAEAVWYQKKHNEAIRLYHSALEKQPKGEIADRARYHLGMSYIAMNKREDAVKELTAVAANSQGVWGESAKQELELLQWEKKYSSVLKTLPPSGLGISN